MTTRKFVDYDNQAYIWEKIKNKFVAKETGKGLSEANFTQDEKAKLANVAVGAEVNVNADWNASTGDAAILNKPSIPEVDTAMSDSSNNAISNRAVKSYIDNAIGSITGINFEVVVTLPATGTAGTIYLVSNSGASPNSYDEYIYVSNNWEKIGTTDVDLSGYQLISELVPLTTAEIDAICV